MSSWKNITFVRTARTSFPAAPLLSDVAEWTWIPSCPWQRQNRNLKIRWICDSANLLTWRYSTVYHLCTESILPQIRIGAALWEEQKKGWWAAEHSGCHPLEDLSLKKWWYCQRWWLWAKCLLNPDSKMLSCCLREYRTLATDLKRSWFTIEDIISRITLN